MQRFPITPVFVRLNAGRYSIDNGVIEESTRSKSIDDQGLIPALELAQDFNLNPENAQKELHVLDILMDFIEFPRCDRVTRSGNRSAIWTEKNQSRQAAEWRLTFFRFHTADDVRPRWPEAPNRKHLKMKPRLVLPPRLKQGLHIGAEF